jgi:hypothetical protein
VELGATLKAFARLPGVTAPGFCPFLLKSSWFITPELAPGILYRQRRDFPHHAVASSSAISCRHA